MFKIGSFEAELVQGMAERMAKKCPQNHPQTAIIAQDKRAKELAGLAQDIIRAGEGANLIGLTGILPQVPSGKPGMDIVEFNGPGEKRLDENEVKGDKYTEGLTPEKMVENLKHTGTPFDYSADDQLFLEMEIDPAFKMKEEADEKLFEEED